MCPFSHIFPLIPGNLCPLLKHRQSVKVAVWRNFGQNIIRRKCPFPSYWHITNEKSSQMVFFCCSIVSDFYYLIETEFII